MEIRRLRMTYKYKLRRKRQAIKESKKFKGLVYEIIKSKPGKVTKAIPGFDKFTFDHWMPKPLLQDKYYGIISPSY